MSIKHLKQIREQEELADKIRRDGLSESKRIVNVAVDEAATLIEKAKSEADVLYKEAIEKTAKEAEVDYDKEIAQADKECDMLSGHAKKNLEKAVSLIVRKVMN
jgi:vacuolar-type H+-ATPase subunit H